MDDGHMFRGPGGRRARRIDSLPSPSKEGSRTKEDSLLVYWKQYEICDCFIVYPASRRPASTLMLVHVLDPVVWAWDVRGPAVLETAERLAFREV